MECILSINKKHTITFTLRIDFVRWLHQLVAVEEAATAAVRFTHLGIGLQVNLRLFNALGRVLQKAR